MLFILLNLVPNSENQCLLKEVNSLITTSFQLTVCDKCRISAKRFNIFRAQFTIMTLDVGKYGL